MWGEITGARFREANPTRKDTWLCQWDGGAVVRISSHVKVPPKYRSFIGSPQTSRMKPGRGCLSCWTCLRRAAQPVWLGCSPPGPEAVHTRWQHQCEDVTLDPKLSCVFFFFFPSSSHIVMETERQWAMTDLILCGTAVKDNSWKCTNYLIIVI